MAHTRSRACALAALAAAFLVDSGLGFPSSLMCSDALKIGGTYMSEDAIAGTRELIARDAAGNPIGEYRPGVNFFINFTTASSPGIRWQGRVRSGGALFSEGGDSCDDGGSESTLLEVDTSAASGPITLYAGYATGRSTVSITNDLDVTMLPPSQEPSSAPTSSPTASPSEAPTDGPTRVPGRPTSAPSRPPTGAPTTSAMPTNAPSASPSMGPTTLMPSAAPSAMPSAAPTDTAPFPVNIAATGFSRSIGDLDAPTTLAWEVEEGFLHVELTVAKADQFVAWAVSDSSGLMDGADAVVGTNELRRWVLSARDLDTRLSPDGLFNEEVISAGGTSTLRFTRELAAISGGRAVTATGDNHILIAYGDNFGDRPSPHGGNRVYLVVDLETGDLTVEDETPTMVVVHACFMGIAWMLFAPLGVFIAAFKDVLWTDTPGRWMNVHIVLQILALLCNLVGFIVIVAHVGSLELDEHHNQLGLAIFVLANAQAILAAFRPHKPTPQEERTWTRFLFEVGHKSAGLALVIVGHLNVASGLNFDSVEDGSDFQIIPIILLALFLGVMIAKHVYTDFISQTETGKMTKRDDQSATAEVANVTPHGQR